MTELGDRADAIRNREVMPEEDNMLKVCMDGRKAALDLRLLGRPMTVPGKIKTAAERVAGLWLAHRDDTYPGPDGQDAPVRGSLQLVFCDIGTPGDDWNVYDELRDQLTARGLPRDAIRFVHDAKTDRDKGELFAACRAGTVAVLIGSTGKNGRRHQRPAPRHRPAPPGLPVAPGQVMAELLEAVIGRHHDRQLATMALIVWSEALRNPALAERLEAAAASMSQDMAALVRKRQQAGTWTGAPADVLARVILSILPGFLLNLALLGPRGVAGFPDAVRTLWPS